MNSRGPVVWYLGLILAVVAGIAISLVLLWIASGEQIQVNQFYEEHGNEQLTDEEYRYWDLISRRLVPEAHGDGSDNPHWRDRGPVRPVRGPRVPTGTPVSAPCGDPRVRDNRILNGVGRLDLPVERDWCAQFPSIPLL